MSDQALTPAEWAEARALFELLVDLPAAQRPALLANSGASARVQREARSLLDHADAGTGGFLSAPAEPVIAANAQDSEPDRAGQTVGPWRITHLLGRGGMGEVWAASRADGAYEGRAAIKVLKRGMDSARVLHRFAQEQRALARLNHPHIAHLLDAGKTGDAAPYFVMEAVDGQPIDRACAGLALERRLALFLQLADAVAHAHRQLLVHRDLKPSNVLVNAAGQVKLLDFGIAKALDPLEGADGHATVAGERPFTPHYASPEQVRGEPVGTATDIYSLGVLLYVMLTGVRPYGRSATSAQEAARSVLEEEPTRPSALSPGLVADPQWLATRKRLAGDLDNILLKALDKRGEHRYPSVEALAADIRAHLAGFPVSARTATWGYQARKFVGRHRLSVGLAALGLVCLLGGLAATLWQKQQADLARAQAEAERALAQQRYQQARQMANQLVFKYHDQVEFLPGASGVREALLTDAVAYMDKLRTSGGTDQDPGLAEELANAYYRISRLQGADKSINTGQFGPAEANMDKALALTKLYLGRPDVSLQALSRAVSMHVAKAESFQRRGQMAEAEQAIRQGVPMLDQALARDPKDSWALAGAVTLNGIYARILGNHLNQAHLGRWQEACTRADQARAAADATLAADPGNAYAPDTLAFTLGEQAQCQLLQGRAPAAAELFTRQVALRDEMAQKMPDDLDFRWQRALSRGQLARALSAAGQHAQALALLGTAEQLAGAAAQADAQLASGKRHLQALGLLRLQLLLAQGDRAGAQRQATRLLPQIAAGEGRQFADMQPRAEALVTAARAWQSADAPRALALAQEAQVLLQPARANDDNVARRWLLAQAQVEEAAALASKGQAALSRAAAQRALANWSLGQAAPPPALQPALALARRLAQNPD